MRKFLVTVEEKESIHILFRLLQKYHYYKAFEEKVKSATEHTLLGYIGW